MDLSSLKELYFHTAPYWAPPVAVGVSLVPVFYGFQVKSALQLGRKIPALSVEKIVTGSWQGGRILAGQVTAAMFVEMGLKYVAKKNGVTEEGRKSVGFSLGSAFIVALISAPPLVAFNGLTMNPPVPVMKSIAKMDRWSTLAIIARETFFFTGMLAKDPLKDHLQGRVGKNKATEYGVAFFSGGLGTLLGHPFDTMLTRWSEGFTVENFRQSMRGSVPRTLAGATLGVIYTFVNNILQSK